jgi:S-adenosylmethionine decarboxylase
MLFMSTNSAAAHPLGYHYIIELYECKPEMLRDAAILEKILHNCVKDSGATEIGRLFHKFSPQGVSGVILISESHFSIHTWPEHGYAAVDFFTCNPNVNVKKAYDYLVHQLYAENSTITEIKRGTPASTLNLEKKVK